MGSKESIKVGVSGSAVFNCTPDANKKAQEVGRLLAERGAVVVTGDTSGIPFEAVKGAKKAGGFTVGISPASSHREHVKKYRLPYRYTDFSMYTGFGYSGRNLLFVKSTDAIIFICGRVGTLNEFTVAFEDKKVIGVLTGTGGVAEEIDHILNVSKRGRSKIVLESDPKKLVDKLLAMVRKERDF